MLVLASGPSACLFIRAYHSERDLDYIFTIDGSLGIKSILLKYCNEILKPSHRF